MKELVIQFIKFSFVGITAFIIDYGLFLILTAVGVPYLISNIISYTISTIYNFVMSMRYVFAGKEGQTRTQQFIIFVVLSLIGLGLNELFLWLFIGWMSIPAAVAKVMSTFLVMIFNFITRKIFLEDRKPHEREEIADTIQAGSKELSAIIADLKATLERKSKEKQEEQSKQESQGNQSEDAGSAV